MLYSFAITIPSFIEGNDGVKLNYQPIIGDYFTFY